MPLSLVPTLPRLAFDGAQRGSYTLVRKATARAARRQRPVDPLSWAGTADVYCSFSFMVPMQADRHPREGSGREVLRSDPVQELPELSDELVRVALDGDVLVVRFDHEALGLHEVVGDIQR